MAQLTDRSEDSALTQSLSLLADIQSALSIGDLEEVRHSANTLRGAVASALAKAAFEAVAALENTQHEEDLALAERAYCRLRDVITMLNRAINEEH